MQRKQAAVPSSRSLSLRAALIAALVGAIAALLLYLLLSAGDAAAAGKGAGSELSAALAATPDVARGESYYDTCQACHGRDGEGASDGTVPAIGGQHYEVLVAELVAFRHEGRRDIRMENFSDRHHLADAQAIADVAAAIAAKAGAKNPGIGDGRNVSRGAGVYVAYCSGCHGASGKGDAKRRVPRLTGQHYEYLLRQVSDLASGRRPNMKPDHAVLMPGGPMSPDAVAGISDYLSRIRR
jgi:cytochrome c553